MIGKAVLSGLWVCPECRSLDVFFILDHVSLSCFTAVVFLTTLLWPGGVGVCFKVSGWMSCREGCSLWSRGSWLGGSLVSALSFVASCTLQVAHGVFVVFLLLSCVMGLRNMTHKLSSACAEMILSYHLLPQLIFFTHNWNLSRHWCVVVCFLVGVLCGLFLLVLVFLCCFCFWFCVFRFLFFWTWQGNRTMYRSSTSWRLRPYSLAPAWIN